MPLPSAHSFLTPWANRWLRAGQWGCFRWGEKHTCAIYPSPVGKDGIALDTRALIAAMFFAALPWQSNNHLPLGPKTRMWRDSFRGIKEGRHWNVPRAIRKVKHIMERSQEIKVPESWELLEVLWYDLKLRIKFRINVIFTHVFLSSNVKTCSSSS